MTHDKIRGCHMPPQVCDTWHEKEWLTLSHLSGMNSIAHMKPSMG